MPYVPISTPDEEDEPAPEPPCLEVDITDAQIIGRFVDVHGEDLLTIYDRATVDFGFQPGDQP